MRATVLALALVVACAAAAVGAGPAAARNCPVATTPKTVAYERIAGVPANLTSLDVWAPTPKCRVGNRRAPVVMWVHGGGYQRGDKRGAAADKVRLFNQRRGWIFVSVNYRLTRAADPNSANPAPTTSYEFDYYNACNDHWRDAFYGGSFTGGGSIGNCPR